MPEAQWDYSLREVERSGRVSEKFQIISKISKIPKISKVSKILKKSKKFQKIPKNSKKIQKIPKNSENLAIYENHPSKSKELPSRLS